MVALLEPRMASEKTDKVIKNLRFNYSYRVKAIDFSSGIWMIWKEFIKVNIKYNYRQLIHSRINKNDGQEDLSLSIVYGSPNP